MLVSLLIFTILQQIPFGSPACTVNPDYISNIQNTYKVALCTDDACKTQEFVLTNGQTYARCQVRKYNHEVVIKISSVPMNAPIVETFCLTLSGWVIKDVNYACNSFKNLKFVTRALDHTEVYVVGCDDVQQEFPDKENHRIQIVGFDGIRIGKQYPVLLLFPTHEIRCVSNCKESVIAWSINGASLTRIEKNYVIVKTAPIPDSDKGKFVEAKCFSSSVKHYNEVRFYVADVLNISIHSNTEGKPRKLPNMYDAGESVSCTAEGHNSVIKNVSGVAPTIYTGLVDLDHALYITKTRIANKSIEIKLPQNLKPLPQGKLGIICHFGQYKNPIPDTYVIVRKTQLEIGALYLTKLEKLGDKTEMDIYDFIDGDNIQCNKTHYDILAGKILAIIPIYVMFGNLIGFPKSLMSNYNQTYFDNSTSGTLRFIKKHSTTRMYAFCLVDDKLTTPVQIYSGDRPELKFNYIHPPWKTEFHTLGFEISCQGINVEDMGLTCLDCLPDTRMDVSKINDKEVKLTVPKTIKRNANVRYMCTGNTAKFETLSIEILLKVIVSVVTDVDTSRIVLLYGQDYLSCRSTFTLFTNNTATVHHIIVPAKMQINTEPVINDNGQMKHILLRQGSFPFIGPKELVSFAACCPIYRNTKYTCLTGFKSISVSRNYYVNFNMDLNEVYPGNILKCYVCVNYTTDIIITSCDNKNLIPSKIMMIIRNPDGVITTIDWKDEIKAPNEELRPDKTGFYQISKYNVKIACKVKEVPDMILIKMKSCTTNPPPILINPVDKSMFAVGDIVSCTTEDLTCKSGLLYVLYVQRVGEHVENKLHHSLTFTKRHIGNYIKLTCAAGDNEQSKDERFIRVEAEPFNISITILYRVMVYGKFFRCNALGFPPPLITWTQLEGPSTLTISEYFLLIGPYDLSGQYSVICEAKNERGTLTTSASFRIFNPRIIDSDYSFTFYFFVPFLTFLYVISVVASLVLIFQENVFSVPLFSTNPVDPIPLKPKPLEKKKSSVIRSSETGANSTIE